MFLMITFSFVVGFFLAFMIVAGCAFCDLSEGKTLNYKLLLSMQVVFTLVFGLVILLPIALGKHVNDASLSTPSLQKATVTEIKNVREIEVVGRGRLVLLKKCKLEESDAEALKVNHKGHLVFVFNTREEADSLRRNHREGDNYIHTVVHDRYDKSKITKMSLYRKDPY